MFILFLSLCVTVSGYVAYELFSSNGGVDAGTEIKGIVVTGDVIGTVGTELSGQYIVIEPVGDYELDPSITLADITINLDGGLTTYTSTPFTEFEIDVDILGTPTKEIIKDLIVEIPGEYVIDTDSGLSMDGYTFTNSDDSTSCFLIEPLGPASATLVENKNYIFKTGEAVSKDLIEVKITNESLAPGNMYAVDEVFASNVFNGLDLKVDSVVQTSSYFKTFRLYLDGTPTASGEKTINDLKIPSNRTVSNVGDLDISGSITIKINDPYTPTPHYEPTEDDLNTK